MGEEAHPPPRSRENIRVWREDSAERQDTTPRRAPTDGVLGPSCLPPSFFSHFILHRRDASSGQSAGQSFPSGVFTRGPASSSRGQVPALCSGLARHASPRRGPRRARVPGELGGAAARSLLPGLPLCRASREVSWAGCLVETSPHSPNAIPTPASLVSEAGDGAVTHSAIRPVFSIPSSLGPNPDLS